MASHNLDTTIDINEAQKFVKMANEWWREDGDFSALHALSPIRMRYITQHIQHHLGVGVPPFRILDIGCGGGLVAVPLARLGHNVVGIDMVEESIAVARTYAQQSGITGVDYRCCSVEKLEAEPQFDVVMALEVLEHVANVPLFLQSAAALLKPGGLFFLSTINRTVRSYLQAIVAAEYLLRIVPVGTHDWAKFVAPDFLSSALQEIGITTENITGLRYTPWSRKWSMTADTGVNYIMCGIKPLIKQD